MPRPIQAVIHVNALQHNLDIARQHAPNSRLFAVVKANAYGHGIERVYDAFKTADGFALLDLDEAIRLRTLGWKGQIILLEGVFHLDDLSICEQYELSFVVHNQNQVTWLENYTGNASFHIYLKMNSGMNRLGFVPEAYTEIWHMLSRLRSVHEITHMTHFSDADGTRFGEPGVCYQYTRFDQITAPLQGKRSLSNSAAILCHHQIHSDDTRAGILLYGSSPDYPTHSSQDWGIQPSMSLRSEIIAVQDIHAGDSVGYSSTFIAKHPMRIGIVACGYADGYQRISPTGTPILVNGQMTQLIGRVSMDMLAVDLTAIPNADLGAEVVLWGKSKYGTVLPIDEVAASAGTLGYELMCGITARVAFCIEN